MNICRTPCSAKNSRSFVSNKGLSDPNPGPYRPLFRKNGESEPVTCPDSEGCKLKKRVFGGGDFRDEVHKFSGRFLNGFGSGIFFDREKMPEKVLKKVPGKFSTHKR
ncbi:MAG: hypothetical protein M0R30_09690 [Methanoregula sp.]|uniref:hypothetical protein n=1 Tax=Methanoregula sp. TaxID=2052170 RepID=UPI0025F1ECE6|nr:hypothetical protein [Methanoregula sp.]MCK9631903.1 hypothetical protein [Methanoregula sp.]